MRGPGGSDGGEADDSGRETSIGAGLSKGTKDVVGSPTRLAGKDEINGDAEIGQNRANFEEGLRMRRREFDMPGSMPGMVVI